MSYFHFQDKKVYYEILGEGEPLVILNGIMMSTLSWIHFKEDFSKNNQLILVDLLDQGQSDKLDGMEYTQDLQVEMLKAFFDEIELSKIHLFGISYGTSVALQFAVKYPSYLKKILLFNGVSYTSPWLKEIGNAWNKATSDPEAYYSTTIPIIYSPNFYSNNIEMMLNRKKILLQVFSNPVFIQAMVRLTNSSNTHDVREKLHLIDVPTLIVGSEYDYITPVFEQEYLHQHIKNSHLVIIPKVGHASMYENPQLFASLVMGFVHSNQNHFSI